MIAKLLRQAGGILREASKSLTRSPQWHTTRNLHLQLHNRCEACDSTTLLQVHHIKPFHLNPELELDPRNLITLCMSDFECHLLLGHNDNFQSSNPNVLEDVIRFRSCNLEQKHLLLENKRKCNQKNDKA